MNLRIAFKRWLYGRCPGFAGAFPYYGTRTYFPPRSLVFELACAQGIYEAANLRVLFSALRPDTWYFDIGANIGLMSGPILQEQPSVRVLSIEPSPGTYACVARTARESAHRTRWEALAVATGDREGKVEFFCADPALGAFDGVRDTGRAGATTKVHVPLITIDRLWTDRGRPPVSAIKIDVEGAELSTLRGASACLRAARPLVLVEWTEINLLSFGTPPEALLTVAAEMDYEVFAMPALTRVASGAHLRTLMRFDESFVLLPRA